MPAQKRFPTDYPGVFFIEGKGAPNSGHKIERIYYIDYRKDGKRIQEKAGRQYKDNMTPAKANQIRNSKIEGRSLPNVERREIEKAEKEAENNRWTIARLWDLYCDTFPDNKALRNEQNKFNRYLREGIGIMEPYKLSPLDIDRIRINLKKEGKLTTAARILELLRRTLNFGIKRGLIPAVSFKVEIPRLNNQTTEDLTPEQLKRLMEVLDSEDVDPIASNAMRFCLFTGMRKSELFRLQWKDIDFDKGFIHLRNPKGGIDQKIPLSEGARNVLENINQRESVYIFPGRGGNMRNDISKQVNRIKKAAGLPDNFRPLHGLRHVYASMLASSGQVDLHVIQRLLTHKSPQMTQRYAHLRDDALKKASALAGDIISEAMNKDQAVEKVINLKPGK